MRKKVFWTACFVVLLTGFLLLGGKTKARAADVGYSGYLDPETGEPADETTADTGRVEITSSVFFDWNTRDYVYIVGTTKSEIHASVADGMVVTDQATISGTGSVLLSIYKDGEYYEGQMSVITEPGEYVVKADVNGEETRLFTFMIIDKTTNRLMSFSAPDGFYITGATHDGGEAAYDRYTVAMAEEGVYEIDYESIASDLVYSVMITIDRTPPDIQLDGKFDSKGRAHSAVTFSGLESGDRVYLFRDGVEVKPALSGDGTGQILDSGIYTLQVYDAAGNMSEYRFTIMVYFNSNSLIALALFALVITAVVGYILIKREHLKIG
ncbi:MAG: hypothetical protein IJM83_00215 [Firmicutes bacterium]|nr:hypothetical protein [Bacillota bacterium]